jgi:chromosome segregation ATPase
VESRLGPLQELREITRTTEERMTSLNALAEHVNQKIKALENQKHTVERAVVESNRLNEMIWAMDVQIGKLNEGGVQATRTEELIERVEALARDVSGQIETGTQARDDFARDLLRLEKDRSALAEFAHAFTNRLTVDRTALDAFDHRVKGLQASVAGAEKKLDEHAARERRAEAADERVAHLAKQLDRLSAEAVELQAKQATLESLHTSLADVEELARKTAAQYENLENGRQQLDALRAEIREVFTSHAAAVQLRDRLASDRTTLESFLTRVDAFSLGIPALEKRLDTITQKLATVDESTDKAETLAALASDLDRKMTRLATQEQFVERVSGRLDALSTTTGEVDQKLEQQIMRRAELDALRSQVDGVAIQVADAREKLEDVSAVQQHLVPLTGQLSALTGQIETAHARFLAAQRDETALAEQERRLAILDERARVTADEIAARISEAQGLSNELQRSVSVKNELVEELAAVQSRQHDVALQLNAADTHATRLELTAKQLEQRGSQLAFAEKRLGAFETRLVDLSQMANDIDATIQRVAERETVVQAVRREVEGIHEISARSKADLDHVEAHRAEMVTLRDKLDGLLATIAETETRIAAIDGRRKVVDEVQLKTNVIVNMLEDVRLNMDTIGEHKTIMEQAMADIARLTELVQESQTTLRALKAERELAGRIERGTKRLRAKTDRGQTGAKPGSSQASDPGLTPA